MLAEFKGAGEAVAEWTKKYGYFFIYFYNTTTAYAVQNIST